MGRRKAIFDIETTDLIGILTVEPRTEDEEIADEIRMTASPVELVRSQFGSLHQFSMVKNGKIRGLVAQATGPLTLKPRGI